MSGAGKTSTLKGLEDLGFEAIDNISLGLLGNLFLPLQREFGDSAARRPITIGIDIRTRDFSVAAFSTIVGALRARPEIAAEVIFLDCSDGGLQRRYAETGHRHPLAGDGSASDGIAAERLILSDLRQSADHVIDTSDVTVGVLKRTLRDHFSNKQEPELALFVTSFSYCHGVPRDADMVFDIRYLLESEPASHRQSYSTTAGAGGAEEIGADVARDNGFMEFFDQLTAFLHTLLPRYAAEGKSYLTIAIGDGDGRRGAVVVAEQLTSVLVDEGWRVHLQHRELNRQDGSRQGGPNSHQREEGSTQT
jgi:UPF0042 nucleotide-binding protein